MLKYFNGKEWIYVPTANKNTDYNDILNLLNNKMDKFLLDGTTGDTYELLVNKGRLMLRRVY